MAVSRNRYAKSIIGYAGFEIIVTGEANVGMLTVMPELVPQIPPGYNMMILPLNLLNAVDAQPEVFQPVQYNQKLSKINQYATVTIYHEVKLIATIQVMMN